MKNILSFIWNAIVSIFKPYRDVDIQTDGEWTDNLLVLHNAQRNKNYPLRINDKLMNAAQSHSDWMAQNGKLSHVGEGKTTMSDRAKKEGYVWLLLAENVAFGYQNESDVVRGWMRSPGHRSNILNSKLSEVGFGKSFDPKTRTFFWCVLFGNPK